MECCWNVQPDRRPTFAQVTEMLLTEYEFVAGAGGRKEATAVTNPLDTASSSTTEGLSSSPDRLITSVTGEECMASSMEQRRDSYPLIRRTGASRDGPLNSSEGRDATTRM